jgi:hypothetical protein
MRTIASIKADIENITIEANNSINPLQKQIKDLENKINAIKKGAEEKKEPLFEEINLVEKTMEAQRILEEIENSLLKRTSLLGDIAAVKKFGLVIINDLFDLIKSLPKGCWCGGAWTPSEKIIFIMKVLSYTGVSLEYSREFSLLVYMSYDKESGIYYPSCLGINDLIEACCTVKANPAILQEIREDILKEKQ